MGKGCSPSWTLILNTKDKKNTQSESYEKIKLFLSSQLVPFSFFITWNNLWRSGTLFAPMYSTVAPASDTTLVGVAKIMVGDSAGKPCFSPWRGKETMHN